MKKDVVKLGMLGLLASICLAANGPSEIAMSKCSKDNTSKNSSMDDNSDSMNEGCGSSSSNDSDCNQKMSAPKPDKPNSKSSGCSQDTSCECESDVSEEADASLLMKTNRKSASKEI